MRESEGKRLSLSGLEVDVFEPKERERSISEHKHHEDGCTKLFGESVKSEVVDEILSKGKIIVVLQLVKDQRLERVPVRLDYVRVNG